PGWREGDEQADRAWYACSPASELSGINGLGNGHPATDLINNAPSNQRGRCYPLIRTFPCVTTNISVFCYLIKPFLITHD
ncbi:hypothetical protein, partial [Aeromonas caviae]|uniref:hypothetical protein n=1 Tax=Aeromonas caviae TaxID=648 RepID=UPI001F2CB3BF